MTTNNSSGTGATRAGKAADSSVETGRPHHTAGTRNVLKQFGLRYSRPREVILGYLLEEDKHVSAESLYVDLKQRGEDLSLSTVYLNLSTLANVGLVREFKGPSGQALYDSNVTPHYHVVCRETGEVCDIPAPEINGVSLARFLKEYVEAATGWQVDEPRFSLTGLAPEVQRHQAGATSDNADATTKYENNRSEES